MKHNLRITIIILAMFLLSQIIGLLVIDSYYNYFGKGAQEKIERGELVQPEVSVVQETVPPEVELNKPIDIVQVLVSIGIAIVIATLLFFLLSKIRITLLLKAWFSFVVFICLSIAIALLIYPVLGTNLFTILGKSISVAELIAVPLAIILTFYKIIKRNIIIHNITEVLIYPGLAVIFLPLLNVIAASILLIGISIYDIIAVWKTKYMVRLAKFQIQHLKIFTGFFLPYMKPKDRAKFEKLKAMAKKEKARGKNIRLKKIKVPVQIAALGGGDVAFPLIFAGTILMAYGFIAALITILCATLSLLLLFVFSEKGKFYPAMPFLTAGCLLGLLLIILL
ncbi:MAG: presenilin family intramembrane aspartyl protease [Candidatus Pacearchaeota archaeon]